MDTRQDTTKTRGDYLTPRIVDDINFPRAEEEILKYWQDIGAFQASLEHSKNKPRFTFYDGPPFATGLPHYGHILAGTIKDVVTRYAHQMGYHVERRFGWDCHGLPIEYEIDQHFQVKSPADVAKMGIDVYNSHCRRIVSKYAHEWETTMSRLGRWIDFKNDYKTMYPWYMESIWWVFKQLYVKGLVYQGHKIMPYSNACGTPLSNFEAGQNYKQVTDPAIVVALPLVDHEQEASLLIWTTTPWTLPSNLAVCVHPQLVYALFQFRPSQKYYIMLESRIEIYFSIADCEIVRSFPGFELKNMRYGAIFPYYRKLRESGAFRVLVDEYVSAETGTGIVHQAPYFGEDDYRVCLMNGVITKEQEPVCPLDANGFFTKPVIDFAGVYVKNADEKIIVYLKRKGLLVRHGQIQHSYPFCWRSDTPLIYRSVKSWFVRVEHMREALIQNASRSRWVPEGVRDKRFANWLSEARDWAVSRNRFWGTPIPIWMSDNEIRCVESIEELELLTGQKITDLHRDSIDHLTIPSSIEGNPPLERIPEVFDCWFESGCMPYAQVHYPFESQHNFEEKFPADFVAEGIDQTRGWFYTLLVISTALFNTPPFKNIIVNGLVLAADGQKMSKRKKNYPDPMVIVNKFGADALRLYLINSPVVRAENLRFKEDGVKAMIKDVFLPWYNAFRFLIQNIGQLERNTKRFFFYKDIQIEAMTPMDRWIVSFTQSLLDQVYTEMGLYRLYKVVPELVKYFDALTNWYVRMNRKRLKGDETLRDTHCSLSTLYHVLFTVIQLMSPFTPFLTEKMYLVMRKYTDCKPLSVHHLMLPKPNKKMMDPNIERSITRMQTIIELARTIREEKSIPLRYQLQELVIVHHDMQYIEDILSLEPYILTELNIAKMTTSTDKTQYGIKMKAEPDYKMLGARLKEDMKTARTIIKSMTDEEINEFLQIGRMHVNKHEILVEHVRIFYQAQGVYEQNFHLASDHDVVILLNITLNQEMIDQGMARDIINRIQKLRKKAHLEPTDAVVVYYDTRGTLDRICQEYQNLIESTIKAQWKHIKEMTMDDFVIIQERQLLKSHILDLVVCRHVDESMFPTVRWANLHVIGAKPKQLGAVSNNKALILLEAGGRKIDMYLLKKSISTLFGLESYNLCTKKKALLDNSELRTMDGQTIFITPPDWSGDFPEEVQYPEGQIIPYCKVHNFVKDGVQGTIVLENPQGSPLLSDARRDEFIEEWIRNVEKRLVDIV